MKLEDCLGNSWLGLDTVGECVNCVRSHAISLFEYSKIDEELDELYTEIENKLPSNWEYMTAKDAADIIGYDLEAYCKNMDVSWQKEQEEYDEIQDKIVQFFGVL